MNNIKTFKEMFTIRTFARDDAIPKVIRKNINDDVLEAIKGKDVNITIYVEIEELWKK